MRRKIKIVLILTTICTVSSIFMTLSTFTVRVKTQPDWIFVNNSLVLNPNVFTSAIRLQNLPLDLQDVGHIRLFEHAARLNSSTFQKKCNIKMQELFVQSTQTDTQNVTHAYRLIVPKWQSRTRMTRYFLSAIVRLRLYKEDKARWTIAELKQWIHYQLWAGAEHIYICNHHLKPEEVIQKDLLKYEKAGLVTVIDWSHIKAVPGSANYQQQNANNQIGCYNHVKDTWGHLSTWMYTFDMDENPFCPEDTCEGYMTRFLKDLDNGSNSDVGLLLLDNYVLHGQGDRSRDIHYDRINRITPKPQNGNVKSIFRTNWTIEAGMHGATLGKGRKIYANASKLKMLHYWGARSQKWGQDTQKMVESTLEFNDVRETIAIAIRHSLIAFGDLRAFNNTTGP